MKDLLSKINQKKIAQYQAHLEKLELSEATIKRRLSTLRKFYNWAEKEGYLKKLPQRAPAIKEIPSIKRLQFLTSKLRPSLPPMPTIPYISDAYEIYQSISITKYLHYAILIIFCVGLGMGIYYQLTGPKAEPIGAYPTALTPPKRYLSFQGRLTDSSNNPITDSTDFVFKLYNAEGTGCPPSGGVQLWSGSCSIDPDEDGIFSVLLGSDCGSEISESVFSENADVWLEITVGTDPYDEILCPRIQIATVGYALNAETLQGYPPGTGINRIPYIDNTGKITIAAASPTIESTSGTFAITGQALSITTATGSNGNIVLAPDGVGTLNINVGGTGPGNQVRITDANISAGNLVSVYAGTSATGFNLLNLSSGTPETTVFSVDESGNTYVAGNVGIGTTAPGATLEVVGDIKIGTLASGSTNDVLIHSGNIVQQRTIDSRVWGSTLVDYSGTSANYIPKMSDTETITNSIIYETGGQIGIGTTAPGATLEVVGDIKIGTVNNVSDNNQVLTVDSGIVKYINTTDWDKNSGDDYSAWLLAGDSGTVQTIGSGDTVSLVGGIGIGTTSSATDTLTININQAYGFAWTGNQSWAGTATFNNNLYLPGSGIWTSGNVGIGTTAPGATLEVVGDIKIGTVNNVSDNNQVLTVDSGIVKYINTTDWDKNSGDDYSAWLLAGDSGTVQTIGSGDTVSLVGGIGIGTTSSATDTLTININQAYGFAWTGNQSWAGSADFNGNVSIDDASIALDNATATNLAVTGDFSINTNDLFVEKSSGYLGIGTTDPEEELTVEGDIQLGMSDGTRYLYFHDGGSPYPGIRYESGTNKMQFSHDGSSWNDMGTGGDGGYWTLSGSNLYPNLSSYNVGIGTTGSAGSAKLYVAGNVGIGTTNPGAMLDLVDNSVTTGKIFSISSTSITSGDMLYLANKTNNNAYLIRAQAGSPSLSNRLTLDSSGNLKIYDDSGTNTLNLSHNGSNAIITASAGNIEIGSGGGDFLIGDTSLPVDIHFVESANIEAEAGEVITLTDIGNITPDANNQYNLGSDTLRWANLYSVNGYFSGNVGIGTTSPAYLLDVSGNVNIGGTGTIGNIPLVSDNNRVLTSSGAGSGEIQYINTTDWDKNSGDDYSAWLLAGDSGTIQTIGSGDTVSLVGGIGIGTTSSATDTLTINVDQSYGFAWTGNQSWAGSADFNGNVSIDDASIALDNATATNLAVTGDFSINTNDLFVEKSSGYLGIGTTDPEEELTVEGDIQLGMSDGTRYLYFHDGGSPYPGIRYESGTNKMQFSHDGSSWNDMGTGGDGGYWTLSGSNLYPNLSAYNVGIGTTGSTGSAKLYVNGNVGIGTTAPGATLEVVGDIKIGTLASGSTNDVLIHSGNIVQQRTIDSRVWGSTLVDYSGTSANYIPKMSDTETITNSIIYETGGQIGIGTTNPGATLEVAGGGVKIPSATANTTTLNLGNTVDLYGRTTSGSEGLVISHTAGDVSITLENNQSMATPLKYKADQTDHFSVIPASYFDLYFFEEATSGQNKSLRIYGYPTGGTLNYANLQIIGTNNDLQISTNKASSDIILTPSSYVGIGTNDPESILHIKSSTANSGLTIQTGENTNNQGIAFENSAGSYTWHIYRADAGSNYADLRFASGLTTLSGLTDRVTFTADGNVGIGTTSPAYLLDVSGNVNIGGTGTIGNIPLVSDNNRVLTSSGVGSGEIQYINTSDWDKDSGDDYSAWLLAGDSGTVQTIGSGDTVSLVGGIGIGTTSSATDTLTINVDQSYGFAWTGAQSWSNTATFNGTLDANGDVTLGDGGDQVSITDDNWSISSAGAISGITTLSMSNQLTNSYANTAAINLTGAGAGITFGSSGPYQIITGGSTDLALMPGGNVGIGTTGPGTAFVVDGLDTAIGIGDEDGAGTPNAGIQFLDAGNRHVGLRFDGSKLIYEDASASRLPSTWYNNATADFIVRNGSVGIGTTDPGSYNLNVAGTAAFDNAGVIIDSNSYVNANRFVDMGSNYYIDPAHTTISGLFAGKVGIGTTDPGAPLDVLGEVQIADGNTAKISIFGTAGSETAGENSIYESGGTFNFTSEKGFQFGIDNDDNGANFFKIYSGGIGGTEIYQVNENGDLTMSGDLTVSGGNLALNSSIDTGDDIQIDPVSGGADAYLDIYNTDGLATLYIQNDSGTYAVDVDIEGDLIVSGGNLAVGTTKQNARAINAAIDYASGVSNAIGGYFDADVSGTGTGSPRGIQIYADITNASNTSDVYGIYIPSLSTTSTAGGNVYGIYTANPTTAGTGNLYAAYFDGANANVYMGGDLTVNGGDITGANGETIDIGEAINNRIQVNADASGGYFQLGDNLNLLSAKDTYFDIWGTTDRTLTIYNSDSTYVVDVSLEDDLTVGGNLTVGSDLTVSGNDIWGGTDSTLRIETDENLSVYLDRDADVAGQFVVFDDADAAVFRAYETGRLWGGSFTSSGTKALCLSDATPADGGYINDCSGTPEADIAEYYGTPIDSGPGDLMSLDQSQALMFKKADQAYSPNIIGIISTAPIGPLGEILGDKTIPEDRNPQPLSLTGRVPIKVSLENGPIAIGDPLTSSSTPGVAMKATKAGVIIGRALENYDGSIQISPGVTLQEQHRFEETGEVIPLPPEGIGKILVYFNPSWYDPDVYLVDTGDIQITQSIGESENQNIGESEKFSLVDAAGEVIERIGVFSEAVIAELRVGLIKTQEIITKKLASQEVTTEKLISPLIETQEIKTERISLQEIETEPGEDIVFNLQEASESGFGKLVVNGKGGEEVASIDAEGNATFAGELHAKKVVAEEIVGLEGKFGELLAATVSAQKIEGLEERLAQLESEPSPSPTASPKSEPPATESGDPMNDVELSPDIEALVNEILGTSLEATPQAELAYTEGEDLNIINSLTVLGTTSLADTSIAGSLNVGGTMSLTDNSINSLTGTLYLQNLGLGGIDILAGKVTIDEQGNAVFEGDVTIKGRLALSEIEPLPGEESIVIDLSPEEEQPETESKFGKLLIRGVDDEIVASIEASGTATFKKLAIAKAEEEVTQISETEIETNATAGTAVLKAGETELTVKNSNITDKSLIYLTPISDTENKVLFVEAKKAHQEAILDDSGLETIPEEIGWFKVAIDVAIDTDIQFNWWIIN